MSNVLCIRGCYDIDNVQTSRPFHARRFGFLSSSSIDPLFPSKSAKVLFELSRLAGLRFGDAALKSIGTAVNGFRAMDVMLRVPSRVGVEGGSVGVGGF
jgi:hypothetical protein